MKGLKDLFDLLSYIRAQKVLSKSNIGEAELWLTTDQLALLERLVQEEIESIKQFQREVNED